MYTVTTCNWSVAAAAADIATKRCMFGACVVAVAADDALVVC